jgi:hypothetical protein
MRVRCPHVIAILAGIATATACANPLARQYEYEEQLYLAINGSATVVIDASIPSLVALHGLPLDPSLRAPVDRDQVRRLFATAGCQDVRVGQPWVRRGRRFVQIRVAAADVAQLSRCGPLDWSTYTLTMDGEALRFRQTVRPPDGAVPPDVGWDGRELVAFKLHAPSRVTYHNLRRLEDGEPAQPGRGNILTWEQRLADRLAGQPVEMEVRMDSASILYRTLWLFGGALTAAVLVLLALVWWTMRRGRQRLAAADR